MSNFAAYFRGKRITLMGLGLLGRGLGDAAFLAECGADLIVTDLKSEDELAPSLEKLKKYKNIRYTLGGHTLDNFRNRDIILKAAGIPLASAFIAEARRNDIPVRMSADLFAEFSGALIVGVTGTRGKSTVAHLIGHILTVAAKDVLLGGNVRGISTLALLPQATPDTTAVLELDSWQLQGFGEAKMSPHVAVFATFFPDHLNYYGGDLKKYFADKAHIFLHQNNEDYLILGEQAVPYVEEYGHKRKIAAHTEIVGAGDLPKTWVLRIPGEHNRYNAALAMASADALGVEIEVIKKAIESFEGIEGRLQFVREIGGVKIYNDNNATTPEATIAALQAVGNTKKKNVVLIIGGDDKKLDMSALVAEIPKWCSRVVMFRERGTDRIRDAVFALEPAVRIYEEEGLEKTVRRALEVAESGEVILYSPSFSSFGKYYKNEFDRNDQFMKLVKEL